VSNKRCLLDFVTAFHAYLLVYAFPASSVSGTILQSLMLCLVFMENGSNDANNNW